MAQDISYLQHENNPEILRELVRFVLEDNERLNKKLNLALLANKKAEQVELDLSARYSLLRRDYFSQGREKLSNKNIDRARDNASQAVLIHAESLVPAPKQKDIKALPSETIHHTATNEELNEMLRSREPELAKDFCADFKEMASFVESSKEVTIVERKFIEIIHERQKYKTTIVNPTSGEEKEVILAAPGPEKLLPGCTYGIELAVAVVVDKYLMHLPLERQRRQIHGQGLRNISVKTLWNLCWAVGEHLAPIANKIRLDILQNNLTVHADETPWPVQGKDSNGQMWSISNMAGAYYAFEPTRSGKVIEEILEGFSGAVMSDGFAGYNRLKINPNIELSNCWSHVRRKFFDIAELNPNGPACEMVEMLDLLFSYERGVKTLEELKVVRQTRSAPLVAKIKSWMEEQTAQHLPESQMRKAIAYTFKLWQGLTLFLRDERVPLSNNDAERTLRHAVVGRKNFYGSKTIDGADLAATLYTVIESCKRVELEPRAFIEMAVRASARGEDPPSPLQYARTIRSAVAA